MVSTARVMRGPCDALRCPASGATGAIAVPVFVLSGTAVLLRSGPFGVIAGVFGAMVAYEVVNTLRHRQHFLS